jgi:phenylalanyl-tRNA synthetase beta chain
VTAAPPAFRPDLEREIDLIEEVCRLTGYDKIPSVMPSLPAVSASEFPDFSSFFASSRHLRRVLSSAGLNEAVNYSFEAGAFNDLLGLPAEGRLTLMNPLDSNQDMMRVSLLPGLLSTLLRNARFLNVDLGLYELGRVFPSSGEEERAAILLSGKRTVRAAHKPSADWDFYDLKGLVESCLEGFGVKSVSFRKAEGTLFHKGQTAEMLVEGRRVGLLGRLNPRLQEKLELRQPVYLAEWSLEALRTAGLTRPAKGEMERFLPVRRDISLLCPADADCEDLTAFIAARPEIASVALTDVYRGDKIGPDRMSLTFSVRLRQTTALTDAVINAAMEALVKDLQATGKISLR